MVFVFAFAFAGDFYFKNLEFTAGTICEIDTIETFDSDAERVGIKNQMPTSLTITHILVPASDSVDCNISLSFSNDQTNWYSYGDIDTVDLGSVAASSGATVIGKFTITTIPDYEWFKVNIASNTVDTFSEQLQKSINY
jgi:hypothetical protein